MAGVIRYLPIVSLWAKTAQSVTLQLSKKKENIWKKKTLKPVISCLSKTEQQRVFFPPFFLTLHTGFLLKHMQL